MIARLRECWREIIADQVRADMWQIRRAATRARRLASRVGDADAAAALGTVLVVMDHMDHTPPVRNAKRP